MTILSELIVNRTEIADLFGVSSASITQLVDAGTIARLPGKKYQVRVIDPQLRLASPERRFRAQSRQNGQGRLSRGGCPLQSAAV